MSKYGRLKMVDSVNRRIPLPILEKVEKMVKEFREQEADQIKKNKKK